MFKPKINDGLETFTKKPTASFHMIKGLCFANFVLFNDGILFIFYFVIGMVCAVVVLLCSS